MIPMLLAVGVLLGVLVRDHGCVVALFVLVGSVAWAVLVGAGDLTLVVGASALGFCNLAVGAVLGVLIGRSTRRAMVAVTS